MNHSKILILITVILIDLLAGMEFDLFTPSFPELQSEFALSPFWVEALLSINFIGFCISLFFVGGLADNYGRKPIILWGLVIFIIGSILCLWSNAHVWLFVGRFLQGVGIAGPATLSFLIIADTYPIKEQRFLLAMLNGVMNTAVAASPIVGSLLTLHFNWQGNFTALLLLGFIALIASMLFVPNYALPEQKESISLRGYIPIFKSKPMLLLTTYIVIMIVPYWIFVGISPLLYMESLGVTLKHFGYYQGCLAFIFAIGSVGFGFAVNHFDQKKMLHLTNCFFMFSLICMAFIVFIDSANPLLITLAFIPFIIGQVIPSVILYPLCINYMPEAKARVTAVIRGGHLILSAVFLQVVGFSYDGTFQNVGIIIMGFIMVGIVMLLFVIHNAKLSWLIQHHG